MLTWIIVKVILTIIFVKSQGHMSIQSFITNLVLRHQFKRQGKGKLDVNKARHMVNKMAKRYPPPPASIEHKPVAARPEHKLCAAEWLNAPNAKRTIVYFHGGGWVVGAPRTTHRMLAALLALDTGCAVVSVDYRLAPEHPFPTPADDARDALALSPAMQRFAETEMASEIRLKGQRDGLIDALYTRGRLQLDYDAETTRTAAEAFAAKRGDRGGALSGGQQQMLAVAQGL